MPAEQTSRPVARDLANKLQRLAGEMTDQMLADGYNPEDVTALADLINAYAAYSQAGLAVRTFLTNQREAERG